MVSFSPHGSCSCFASAKVPGKSSNCPANPLTQAISATETGLGSHGATVGQDQIVGKVAKNVTKKQTIKWEGRHK
jgi:hypothetical protein